MEHFSPRWIGVDPGKSVGVVVIDGGRILAARNWARDDFWEEITTYLLHRNCTVVIEDIKPFALQLTPDVIDTCKFIGEMIYRLKMNSGASVVTIPRASVQRWAFERCPDIVVPLIKERIHKKFFAACDVQTRDEILCDSEGNIKRGTVNYVWVNDKIVTQAVKSAWRIPQPLPGNGYAYGLKDHAWQALGAVTAYGHGYA